MVILENLMLDASEINRIRLFNETFHQMICKVVYSSVLKYIYHAGKDVCDCTYKFS